MPTWVLSPDSEGHKGPRAWLKKLPIRSGQGMLIGFRGQQGPIPQAGRSLTLLSLEHVGSPLLGPSRDPHDTSLVSMATSVSTLTAVGRDYKFVISCLGLALRLLQPPAPHVLVGLICLLSAGRSRLSWSPGYFLLPRARIAVSPEELGHRETLASALGIPGCARARALGSNYLQMSWAAVWCLHTGPGAMERGTLSLLWSPSPLVPWRLGPAEFLH